MADSASNQEKQVKILKRRLEGWREIVLLINSILIWEKNWYPGIIGGTTTILFLILYSMETSLLTILAITGLSITLIDYLVPLLSTTFYSPESWTGVKEKELEEICRDITKLNNKTLLNITSFYNMRDTRPAAFYATVIISCLSLAWIGNTINNLFLTYVIITSVLLAPGIRSNGMVTKYSSHIIATIKNEISNRFVKKE